MTHFVVLKITTDGKTPSSGTLINFELGNNSVHYIFFFVVHGLILGVERPRRPPPSYNTEDQYSPTSFALQNTIIGDCKK